MNAWKHPSVPADSSINFDYYVEKARRAEAAGIDRHHKWRRAGWNSVTSPLEGSAKNFSRAHGDHALRYQIADEYIEVVSAAIMTWLRQPTP